MGTNHSQDEDTQPSPEKHHWRFRGHNDNNSKENAPPTEAMAKDDCSSNNVMVVQKFNGGSGDVDDIDGCGDVDDIDGPSMMFQKVPMKFSLPEAEPKQKGLGSPSNENKKHQYIDEKKAANGECKKARSRKSPFPFDFFHHKANILLSLARKYFEGTSFD